MIQKIIHLSDYHIHNQKWHERYREGNEFIYKQIENIKPERIVIVGDLFDNFIQISNEAKILAAEFIRTLLTYSKVIIVPGNHDIRKNDIKRKNSVETIVNLLNDKNLVYLDKSGFYEDENVVWVNHSHLEKNINPWLHINHERKKDKIYIDLFHDPVNSCVINGIKLNSSQYRNISDFKGDYGFFGDIHKFQYLDSNKRYAYCSSTFQQNFGEDVDEHGFLVWDIIQGTSQFIKVEDKYKLITFKITEGFDYDNINFDSEYATNKSEFRIIWNDYASNINNENERKIVEYISSKWNKNIKFEKERIYTHIKESNILTESVNINDLNIQREIFIEYLKNNKYDEKTINEILKIDDIVNSRLDNSDTINGIEWSIDKLWVDNFKSYDKFELDLKNINGIIQIGGENQNGKTTLLDAITYALYGVTLSTHKLGGAQREKFGDNRYINNKRKLDYCEVGLVINVNNENYTIVRRTERKWNRKKTEIISCSTTLDIYRGDSIDKNNILNGEVRVKTQQKIEKTIGSFEDFIRLSLTNSENLNYLISLDRATFIDSIIFDAGFDIFEKKLEIFKAYKKELTNHRIDINIDSVIEEIKNNENKIIELKENSNLIDKHIENIKISLDEIDSSINKMYKKLNKIDERILNINISDLYDKRDKIILEKNNKLLSFDKLNKTLNIDYSNLNYQEKEEILNTYNNILNEKLNIEKTLSTLNLNKIEYENNNKILNFDIDKNINEIKIFVNEKIDSLKNINYKLNSDIKDIKVSFNNTIKEYEMKILAERSEIEYNVKTLYNELLKLKSEQNALKDELEQLNNNKPCNVCGALPEYQVNKQLRIEELNRKIKEITELGRNEKMKYDQLKEKLKDIEKKENDIKNKIYDGELLNIKNEIQEKINVLLDEIKNNELIINKLNNGEYDCDESVNNFVIEKNKIIEDIKNQIENNNLKILKIKDEIKLKNDEILNITQNIENLKDKLNKFENYEKIVNRINELKLELDKLDLSLKSILDEIELYNNNIIYIEENKKIENEINVMNNEKKRLMNEIDNLQFDKSKYISEISVLNHINSELKDKIEKYKKQVKMDEILKEYNKCISRDGLPTYLLLKSKSIINNELSDLLSNLDFNIFFDDYLNLKFYMKDAVWSIQNLLESSGSERTFGAIALKMALRAINNKSKPNILLLDEVMMRLKGKMVDNFNEMLSDFKNRIDKIFIIEHVHQIPYDVYIEVKKDENLISHLVI